MDILKNPEKQTVAGQMNQLLDSDSSYIQQARQSGAEQAASRGLLNSSISAGASQKAAIDAAMPIAQQDAKAYNDFALTTHAADEAIRQGSYNVTANTQGAYLSAVDNITNNAQTSINLIEVAEDITQAEKDKMIANTISRRDADLTWTKNLYSNMPTWDMSWINLETMPAAPGLGE